MSVGALVAIDTKSFQILGCIIAQLAPPLIMMVLKTFHPPARLATPAVSIQDFPAELAISFRVKS
jgi:hypothetical protein